MQPYRVQRCGPQLAVPLRQYRTRHPAPAHDCLPVQRAQLLSLMPTMAAVLKSIFRAVPAPFLCIADDLPQRCFVCQQAQVLYQAGAAVPKQSATRAHHPEAALSTPPSFARKHVLVVLCSGSGRCSTKTTLHELHLCNSVVSCGVQDAPRVVPRVIVELAPEALVNMLTKAPGASISLLAQLCRQQGFDGLVGERRNPAHISSLKAPLLHLRI